MLLVDPCIMSGLDLSLLRMLCRHVRGIQSLISDPWKNITGRIIFTMATEGTASQEISKLQQHKSRLDGRKTLLTPRAVRCRECVFKAGYETSITTDWKNGEIQCRVRCVEKPGSRRIYNINSASISSTAALGLVLTFFCSLIHPLTLCDYMVCLLQINVCALFMVLKLFK